MVPKVLYRSIDFETLKKDMKYIKEKVLKEGLEGYKEYTEKVRWRLIPFVW